MKTYRFAETGRMNKILLAEGDEGAVNALRGQLADKGCNVSGYLALSIREAGFIVIYAPAPAICAGGLFRFSFSRLTDKDVQYQQRLKSLRAKRGGMKVRRWSPEQNCMVTEEMTPAIYPHTQRDDRGYRIDPQTGLPLLG